MISLKTIIALCIVLLATVSSQPPPISSTTTTSITPSVASQPVITKWVKSTGYKGYNGALSDVQKVQYSNNYVYISSTSIPGTYTVGGGGWADDPYYPAAQNFVVKLPRYPTAATISTPILIGYAGILLNGVVLYNANDGNSYNNAGFWYRNAYFFEGYSFDNCFGHSSVNPLNSSYYAGVYHHHALPICFSTANSTSGHSPLLGYAFDGFPIYGPYGYSNATNSSSAIKKLSSSYYAYNYPNGIRSTFGNGTAISNSANWGPNVTTTYQLNHLNSSTKVPMTSGAFLYDWVYSSGYGDLNAFNGRFQVTPEYPSGIFCYIFTASYPFLFGPGNYYGNVASMSTSNTISESTTTYFNYSASG
jgi:hypothetical protein